MNNHTEKKALVFILHGSRDINSVVQMEDFIAEYSALHPEYEVSYGCIELSKPLMKEALSAASEKHKDIVIFPLLFFKSGHAKNDISSAVKEIKNVFPDRKYHVSDVLGVHPLVSELEYLRTEETGVFAENHNKISALFIGRGSSDPDANSNLFRQARLFEEGRNFDRVIPCFEGVARPGIEESADFLVRSRPAAIVVVSHFLFKGILTERIKDKVKKFQNEYPWIKFYVTAELGIHENIFSLIEERIGNALSGQSELECENCKYRYPMPSQEKHMGGLRALLWSIRHNFAHDQTADSQHSHAKIEKHILICGNADCASKGSIRLLRALRNILKRKKIGREVTVTRTSCMGHCGDGPTMVVYPDGIWYRGVSENDADEIVEHHIGNDRLVERLVDTIM